MGEKVCDCDKDYKLNPNTGLCVKKFHCGIKDVGRQDCDKKNALCVNDDDGYHCKCPKTTKEDYNKIRTDFCRFSKNIMECDQKYATCVSNETGFSCECFAGLVRESSEGLCQMAAYTVRAKMILRNPDFVDQKISFYSKTLNERIYANYIIINSKLNAIYSEQNELNKKIETETNKTLIINRILTELKNSLLGNNIIGISKVGDSLCESLDNNFKNFNCDLTLQLSKEIDATNVEKMISNKFGKVDKDCHSIKNTYPFRSRNFRSSISFCLLISFIKERGY